MQAREGKSLKVTTTLKIAEAKNTSKIAEGKILQNLQNRRDHRKHPREEKSQNRRDHSRQPREEKSQNRRDHRRQPHEEKSRRWIIKVCFFHVYIG